MIRTPTRYFAWIVAFVFFFAIGVFWDTIGAEPANKRQGRRPNILFLMADQMRADSWGAGGNQVVRTPNLDRLAGEGVRFEQAYTSTPSCTPTRTTLLTGLAPWHHGLLGAGRMSFDYDRKKPQMLTEAGYHTFGIGSDVYRAQGYEAVRAFTLGKNPANDYWTWFKERAPDREPDETGLGPNSHRGSPFVPPNELHPSLWMGEEAVRFLESYDNKKPFFLKVSFFSPHSPYDPPQKYWDLYKDAEIPKRHVGDWAERHAERGKDHRDDLWQGDLGEEPARKARIGYYGNISLVDDQVGRIIEVLERRGLLDDTFIFFVSDHGDMLGDHYLWRKTYPYESSIRVPMFFRCGKNMSMDRKGLVLSRPVEIRDIMPTFLEVAGVDYEPEWFDGRSLLGLARNPDASWREYIDLEHATCYGPNNNWTALTDGKIKYVFYATEGREELFDLVSDPHELHELSSKPEQREKLELWRARMAEHLEERGEDYVKDGKPVIRPKGITYSPHYPAKK